MLNCLLVGRHNSKEMLRLLMMIQVTIISVSWNLLLHSTLEKKINTTFIYKSFEKCAGLEVSITFSTSMMQM